MVDRLGEMMVDEKDDWWVVLSVVLKVERKVGGKEPLWVVP